MFIFGCVLGGKGECYHGSYLEGICLGGKVIIA